MSGVVRKERRMGQRFTYKRPIRYMAMGDLLRTPDEAPIEGGVVDLSDGGMRIRTSSPHLGKGVILKVLLPVSRVDVNVPLLAEVRWKEEEKPDAFQAGLMFMA